GRGASADLSRESGPRPGPRIVAEQFATGAASKRAAGIYRRPTGRAARSDSGNQEGGVNPLRVAVIGAGHLGRIHARIAAGLEELELVAVADPVAESRESVAAEVRTRAVADFRELIGEIDAAIVATPTSTHHALGVELLGSGLPLLVEKPLAT